MPIQSFINSDCYRNMLSSVVGVCPQPLGNYASLHMDTLPKFLNHAVFFMAICNFFLLFSAWTISFLTLTAAFFLAAQNVIVLLMLNQNNGGPFSGHATRCLAPTEFMVGVCFGITVGGTILALFLSTTFHTFRKYCVEHEEEHACGTYEGRVTGVWWWSSLVFWLNVLTCILLTACRQEITFMSQSQYQSVGQNNNDNNSSDTSSLSFQTDYSQIPDGRPAMQSV